MKIGQLASAAGVKIETIRYCEREALLPRASRTESGYRRFNAAAVQRIAFLKAAQEPGFSLTEIKDPLGIRDSADGDCADMRPLALQMIADIDRKLQESTSMRLMLDALQALVRVPVRLLSARSTRREVEGGELNANENGTRIARSVRACRGCVCSVVPVPGVLARRRKVLRIAVRRAESR